MDKKIENAAKGSYLTLAQLVECFNTEFTTRKETNKKQMAAALVRLGFKYLGRKKAYLSRKFANVNLEKLRIHCLLIEERTEWNGVKGIWVFKDGCPTFFMDEGTLWIYCRGPEFVIHRLWVGGESFFHGKNERNMQIQ